MKYRVIRKPIVRVNGGEKEVLAPGDVIEPYDNELEHFSDNLELIEDEKQEGPHLEDVGVEDEDDDDAEICGTEMSNGETCDRLAEECGYH